MKRPSGNAWKKRTAGPRPPTEYSISAPAILALMWRRII